MAIKAKTDIVLGIFVMIICMIVVFVWIPLDIETGIFEKVRRRIVIGDSFAPILACSILGFGGLLLVIESMKWDSYTCLTKHSWIYAAALFALFVITMTIMRWVGPLAVYIFEPMDGIDYRALRDTTPWKHIGFVLGGTFLVATIISVIEHRLSLRAIITGLVATFLLIGIYDLPFDDLLLPPNGDV